MDRTKNLEYDEELNILIRKCIYMVYFVNACACYETRNLVLLPTTIFTYGSHVFSRLYTSCDVASEYCMTRT